MRKKNRNQARLATLALVALCPLAQVGCGAKTEQAVGTGMMAVGAAVATVEPVSGIAIAGGGAAIATHGAYREETAASK